MKINLVFFAYFREVLDCSNLMVEIPESSCVADLCGDLMAKGGDWQELFSKPEKNIKIAVNQNMAELSTFLNDGDEVAFFPPVTGG